MTRVFAWMTFGLLITGVVAYVVGNNPEIMRTMVGSRLSVGTIILLQFVLVFAISFGIRSMSVGVATLCFLLYSFSVGITTSFIFLAYTAESISQVFFISASTFGAMAVFGAVTKRDLSAMGRFLIMVLIGGIIAMFANFFFHSSGLGALLNIVFVFVFAGLTAYDTQKMRNFAMGGDSESDTAHKVAILGALTLYLDFLNLFLSMLNIMGDRRR
jgi:hypothetical protein